MDYKNQKNKKANILFPLALAMALSSTYAHATDGYFSHGVGIKAKGAGGAQIAHSEEASGIAANPALAYDIGERTDIGLELFAPDRKSEINGNAYGANQKYSGNGEDVFPNPDIAITRKIDDKSAWGVALYGNGGMNTSYKQNPFARFGGSGSAGVNLAQLFISPTYAYRLSDKDTIGASANLLIQGFKAKGISPFSTYSRDPNNFTNKGIDYSTGIGASIGYLHKFADNLSLGAVYKTKTNASDFNDYSGLFAQSGGFDVPSSYGAGLYYQHNNKLGLEFDAKRINYSEVKSVGNSINNLFSGNYFGSANGPGFGWRDINVYKLGVNYKYNDRLTLRAGYSLSQNPIKESETFLNILAPGIVTDQYTIGSTYALKNGVELSTYALYAPPHSLKGNNSIPSSFGGGNADLKLGETAIGVSIGWKK